MEPAVQAKVRSLVRKARRGSGTSLRRTVEEFSGGVSEILSLTLLSLQLGH